jgi:hypothetical protein
MVGTGIVASGGTIFDSGSYRYHIFSSNGTFAISLGSGTTEFLAIAGGGSGGCPTTPGGQVAASGSGGGGAYAESFITDIAGLASSITVTRGAGGSGGAAGSTIGSTGGTSSFGTIVSASGGLGGASGVAATPPTFNFGAIGGTSGTGDLVIPGRGSEVVSYLTTGGISTANGGSSVLGTGAFVRTAGSGAGAGLLYGGGATGASNNPGSGVTFAGAAGGNGIVIVELYA